MNSKQLSDHQDEAIVFFDGVCGLCNSTVDFLMARDQQRRLKFAPLQGQTAEQVVPEDVRAALNTFVLTDSGRLYYRSTAIARCLLLIGGFWGVAGRVLLLIPRPLRDFGYRVISRWRYRLFGKRETCRMPTAEERQRFLD